VSGFCSMFSQLLKLFPRTEFQALGKRTHAERHARGFTCWGHAVAAAARERAGGLLVLSDALTNAHRGRIVELANKNRLPTMYFSREWVDAGGLMAYGPSWRDLYRRAATYVDKILKGAKPGDLPIEQPTTFDLVVNLKTAKALGLTIPQRVLQQATEVIQ
jgi:putative tryptophan/tyrosine transport system substrate-binding protein